MGTLLTVVGGCSRVGTAAFSRSQRCRAALSVTVAMRAFLLAACGLAVPCGCMGIVPVRLQGAGADVAAVEGAAELNLLDRLVSAAPGVGQRVAQRGHAEDPPAVGHDLVAVLARAGVEDLDVRHLRRLIEALDLVA